ncbi:MAG: hypothetical protein ACTSVI_09255 [Promethearchaeota archaeon]
MSSEKKKSTSLNKTKIPRNFILRRANFTLIKGKITSKRWDKSSFEPIENAWNEKYFKDIENAARILIQDCYKSMISTNASHLLGKKVVSLDIETTDYFPKAREGFVNIIALSIMDFKKFKIPKRSPEETHGAQRGIKTQTNFPITLKIYQVFNMLRKKELAQYLLTLTWNVLNDADFLLVFNKKFDIPILDKIIKDNNLNLKLASSFNICDYKEKGIKSLKKLEEVLQDKTGFKRFTTEKGHYSEYYRQFKGIGTPGKRKKIEPIGTYNIFDTLSPLHYYILNGP